MADEVRFAPLAGAAPAPTARPAALHHLQDVPVELTVEIGRTHMTIAETLKLGPGSIVSLNRLAGEPVDLLVNGKLIARGEVVVIDEEFGLRITDVVSGQERPPDVEPVGATPLGTPATDRAAMGDDDIAAYLGGPHAVGADGPVADDDVAAYLGGPHAVAADGPLADDDVAAYLDGLSAGGDAAVDPFAPAAADVFAASAADDSFAAPSVADDPFADDPFADDPFAGVGEGDPVSPQGDAVDPFAATGDVPSHLGDDAVDLSLDAPPAADGGWVVDGDDDPLSPR